MWIVSESIVPMLRRPELGTDSIIESETGNAPIIGARVQSLNCQDKM